MLYKKLQIPINIPLSTSNENEFNEFDYGTIKSIHSLNSERISNIKFFFKNYFSSKISKVIEDEIFLFLNEIIPIIFKSKFKIEGFYQLFRFTNEILYNFPYIEILAKKTFVYENLSKVFLFSGYLTNILTKDVKLLDVLQPEYAMRLNGNITFYKNSFDKVNSNIHDEEIVLNHLRQNQRLLKFQILFALINHEISIKRASQELSLLAQASFDSCLKIVEEQISNKYKIDSLKYSIVAYGRFATLSMTSNSDLDLVFIYDEQTKNEEQNRRIYIELFRQIIKFLSVKTEEGFMYEVDTKLKPSGKGGPVACTYKSFKNYHEKRSFSWEKIALKKTRVINDNVFNFKIKKLLDKLNSYPISENKVADEISMMRTNTKINNKDSIKKETLKWFETKYAGGGQRDIEYLNFFKEKKTFKISNDEIEKKFLLVEKMENLYFILDQIMNTCFEEKKQDHLPSNAINLIIKETNEKDLGSLKATIMSGKKELYNCLNDVVESAKVLKHD
ncbi:MAG: hypothetical protein ACO3NN_00750 [Candidatus Puniceispirillales bacterium]|jgi:glutamine synthetase adenylyltransferase